MSLCSIGLHTAVVETKSANISGLEVKAASFRNPRYFNKAQPLMASHSPPAATIRNPINPEFPEPHCSHPGPYPSLRILERQSTYLPSKWPTSIVLTGDSRTSISWACNRVILHTINQTTRVRERPRSGGAPAPLVLITRGYLTRGYPKVSIYQSEVLTACTSGGTAVAQKKPEPPSLTFLSDSLAFLSASLAFLSCSSFFFFASSRFLRLASAAATIRSSWSSAFFPGLSGTSL